MYTIEEKLITIRSNTRPGTKQAGIFAVVYHWTANPGASAINHYNYFNNGGGGRAASAHYFVDSSTILRIIPDNETAFHANETGKSNVSYLNGLKSSNGYVGNANSGSISIELCVEANGEYHAETLKRAFWLGAQLLEKYNLSLSKVITHNLITGKNCPKNYLYESGAEKLRNGVAEYLGGGVSYPYNVEVITDELNIREKPTIDSNRVGVLKKGAIVSIAENIGTWGRLKNGQGYINIDKSYVKITDKGAEILDLNQQQREKLSAIFKKARLAGVFSSDKHEKEVLNGTMKTDQAVYLVALIAEKAI